MGNCFSCSSGRRVKPTTTSDPAHANTKQAVSARIVAMLATAEKPGKDLHLSMNDAIQTSGWTWAAIAESLFDQFHDLLANGRPMGSALTDAYEKAIEALESSFDAVVRFKNEQPYLFWSLVAVGCLVVLSPWIVECLGFGELGPVAGEYFLAVARFNFTNRADVYAC